MNRRAALGLLAVVVVVAAAFRVYELTNRSFWFDEAFSWMLADRFSWLEMLDRTGRDVHPPGFYAVLHVWSAIFGESVAALRGCAVCFGLLTVVLTYVFCCEALGDRAGQSDPRSDAARMNDARGAGIYAATLVALNSMHIWWSRETRMYTLGTALALFSSWLLLRALKSGDSAIRWCCYAAAAAGLLYTHNYGLFTVVGQFALIGVIIVRQLLRGHRVSAQSMYGGLAACGAVWLYAPWVPVLLQQKRRVQVDFWIGKISLWSIPDCWYELFFPRNGGPSPEHGQTVVLIVTLLATLAWFTLTRRTAGRGFVALLVLAPVVCSAAVSMTTVSITTTRHFLFSHLFLLIVIADVAWRLFAGKGRHVVFALLVFDSMFAHWCYWNEVDVRHKPGVRRAVEFVLERRAANEPVVVMHPCVFYSVKYYCRGITEPMLFLNGSTPKHYYGGPLVTEDDAIGDRELAAVESNQIWVVGTTGFNGYNEPTLPDDWVAVDGASASFPDVFWFQGQVSAILYQRKGKQTQ